MNAQDLKNSILQLAIQGRLVEQRKEEGTAKELMEQIKAEKEQLVKEEKIKKENPLPEITEDEIPFDIPESWEWIRLESVIYNIGNKTNQIKQSEIQTEGKYPVVSQSMNKVEGYSNEESKVLRVSPLKVIVFGDHSKTIKLIDFDFIIGADGTKIFVPISLYPYYLFYVLSYNIINLIDRGYSRHYQFLKQKLIPLPPLEEQKRIVAKIEELMPYVEKYGEAHSKLEVFNKKFPEDMQKSILQLAIQGKLVEQRPEEGTAEELFKQIQEEKQKLIKEGKIKNEKPLSEITEDEIPFEIPESWMWVRLGDVVKLISGKSFYSGDFFSEGDGNNSIKITNIGVGSFFKTDGDLLPKHYSKEFSDYIVLFNDILIALTRPYIKDGLKVCRCSLEYSGALLNQRVAVFKDIYTDRVLEDYIYIYFLSNYILETIKTSCNTALQPNLSINKLIDLVVPLPPLEEQKRIVAKIEELLPFCQQLVK